MQDELAAYSVDASALIWMKDEYQHRVPYFRRLWDFLGALGDQGRLGVAEEVRGECHDEVFDDWFDEHPNLVVPWSTKLNGYVNAVNRELAAAGLPLVDGQATTNLGDPFVLALALMVERRPLGNLRGPGARRCHVVSYERREWEKGLAKIPLVCEHYGLVRMEWADLILAEGWNG